MGWCHDDPGGTQADCLTPLADSTLHGRKVIPGLRHMDTYDDGDDKDGVVDEYENDYVGFVKHFVFFFVCGFVFEFCREEKRRERRGGEISSCICICFCLCVCHCHCQLTA